MMYDVGRLESCVFVYNTSDNSCKLMDLNKVSGLWSCLQRHSCNIDLIKLRLLFGLVAGESIDLCRYNIMFRNGIKVCMDLSLILVYYKDIILGNNTCFRDTDFGSFNILNSDYCIWLRTVYADIMGTDLEVSNPSFCLSGDSGIWGFPIPVQMGSYLLSCNKDLRKMDRAMNGVLFKRLKGIGIMRVDGRKTFISAERFENVI